MSMGKDIRVSLVLSLIIMAAACDQKYGNQSRNGLLRPTAHRFETISEAAGEPRNKEKPQEMDVPGPEKADEYASPVQIIAQQDQGLGNSMPPAPAPLLFPPIATDDDLAGPDHIFGAGPLVVPYARCGDGIRQPLEECDLGVVANATNAQGCNVVCSKPYCGNGVTEPYYPPLTITPPATLVIPAEPNPPIPPNVLPPTYGTPPDTNSPDPVEQCDDGNHENGDGCSSRCQYEICGNAVTDPHEQCDAGAANGATDSGCSTCCLFTKICGNGLIDNNEGCDDGNLVNGDGCSACCKVELPDGPNTCN